MKILGQMSMLMTISFIVMMLDNCFLYLKYWSRSKGLTLWMWMWFLLGHHIYPSHYIFS